MKNFFKNQAGFTLVELMIVIVIVGILAAVAVPIYQGNVKKAKMTECDAALGTIRTTLRVYYAGNGAYPAFGTATAVTAAGLDVSTDDLTGTYFAAPNYTLVSADTMYTITCTNNTLLTSPRTLNQLGVFGGGL
ncbi:MAG: prepilin-type N-terminal cleavage/methylation domain-containing protein [archaeon]